MSNAATEGAAMLTLRPALAADALSAPSPTAYLMTAYGITKGPFGGFAHVGSTGTIGFQNVVSVAYQFSSMS